ncbi:MAG: TetR family transcriptional regulator [Desulfobacterales bacterium]|nr:TetR family transcriptional regulator [Desulfobacterales bacterium]
MTARQTFLNLPETKRRRITEVAVNEFATRGYAGASINRMVDRLQIAKGSVFQYFGDKRGLFTYVFNGAMTMVKDYLRDVRDTTVEEDIFARLDRTMAAGIAFINDHPRVYALYLRIQFDQTTPYRDDILSSLRKYSLAYLRSLLQEARDNGEIRTDLDLDQAAFLLDAVMDRFLQSLSMEHFDAGLGLYQLDRGQAEKWARELVAVTRNGIAGDVKGI